MSATLERNAIAN